MVPASNWSGILILYAKVITDQHYWYIGIWPAREPDVKAVDISHDEHVLIAQETRVLALGGMLV